MCSVGVLGVQGAHGVVGVLGVLGVCLVCVLGALGVVGVLGALGAHEVLGMLGVLGVLGQLRVCFAWPHDAHAQHALSRKPLPSSSPRPRPTHMFQQFGLNAASDMSRCHFIIVIMSFAALLRGRTAVNGQPVQAKRRQHKYDKKTVEASIELGKRVATFMELLYGCERSALMLEKVASGGKGSQPSLANGSQPSLANGSQPSPAADLVIMDLVEAEASDSDGVDHSPALPYGFWRRFCQEEMKMQYTNRKRMQFSRSLKFYVLRKQDGASTIAAMRGMRDRGSCRSSGGALNSRKAAGLGFALLQFFVDNVQRLMSRADSSMLMKQARELRADLVHNGEPETSLPKLIGNAGHQWFKRWRETYGISKKVTGMKLKVPWTKVKRRIRVFLGNIYRLRAFWEICHPETEMRFLSLDQKPSWFNNAGHTGTFARRGGSQPSVRENFAQTRQRYSILTSVPSWGHTAALSQVPDVPPRIALLFKGKQDGHMIRELRKSKRMASWMLVQAQEHGSYRSSDMVEALGWMLPPASNSSESIVLMLDWYSGHLTAEVADLVRSKGHVLIFHGGGCTPFSQINDTHLHASLARLLIQIENEWALQERQRCKNKTPKMNREEILSIVQTAWLSIDHSRVAEKGYKQTGPTMPLRGPVAPEDVFRDLLRVLEEIEPSSTPTEVGMSWRDEAVAFVKDGYETGKWTKWVDCHKLIEEHDGLGEALHEGLEAFGSSPSSDDTDTDADNIDEDTDEDENDDGTDKDENDDGTAGLSAKHAGSAELPAKHGGPAVISAEPTHGDDGLGGGGVALGSQPKHGGSAGLSAKDGGPAGVSAKHEGTAGLSAKNGGPAWLSAKPSHGDDGEIAEVVESERSAQVAAARQVIYAEAVRTRNDTMLRHMRKQMREETQSQRDIGTEVGAFLRKRVQEHRVAETKRLRMALEEERLAANDLEERKLIRARAEQAASEARLASLRQTIVNRRDAQARKRAEVVERIFQRWLQTQYPALLARRCIIILRGMSPAAKDGFDRQMRKLLKDRTFERQLFVKDLWSPDKSLTLEFSHTAPFTGGPRRSVRCGLPFQELVDQEAPKTHFGHDPVETLYKLFSACVPLARRVFTGAYTPLRLLHLNDYVLEKTFVYGIVALSKWLGEECFPHGVYGQWPPEMPADYEPKCNASEPVHLDTTAPSQVLQSIPSQVPLLLGHPGDDNLPLHLCTGSAASSSGSSGPSKP